MTSKRTLNKNGFTRSLDKGAASHWQPKAAAPLLSAGFTLIETLVAVLILTTAIAGPLTIASKSLLTAQVAKDQVTAFYLAQDAVEYVRFVRDSNTLKGANWLTGTGGSQPGTDLTSCISSDGSAVCYVDSIQDSITGSPGGCPNNKIKYNTVYGYFTYGSSNAVCTMYNRTVSITNPLNGQADEAKVAVTVSWSDTGSNTRSVTVYENLFNWQ